MSAVPIPAIEYNMLFTLPAKLNVGIHFDHQDHSVHVSCKPIEHLSNYLTREVVFRSDYACTVSFDNPGFFGVSEITLAPNHPQSLSASSTMTQGETNGYIELGGTVSAKSYVSASYSGPQVPIRIIVP